MFAPRTLRFAAFLTAAFAAVLFASPVTLGQEKKEPPKKAEEKFDREAIHGLRAAYRMIFSTEGTLQERVEDAATLFRDEPLVQDIVSFVTSAKDRAICLPAHMQSEE